ncbi:PE-PPE domain-containing protein [Mycobacterium sp.]|uniref:PE-PPE domain-containing protein n=1 Tax=Mycobacterium sp. TaxID=1785 RepID=UPI002B58FA14|nr:PE-PPE domain-containing protein [Mycobacterium sp.]HTQ16258.1 PE-PPE domain-containing protein [Mycobacterium sp.]
MSLVVVEPEALAAAASDLTSLGSAIGGANATAAAQTTGLLAAGADEVSTAIAALFGAHGQAFQVASARAAAFHQEFVQALTAGAGSYATVEAAAASRLQSVLDPINAQAQAATGGAMGSIYRAIQQANEKLLIGFTNVVGRLEQPLVPFFEGLFGPPVTPPVPLPAPINGAVSLVLSGTEANVVNPYLVAQITQEYNLPGGVGTVWQPSQFFPLSPHLGNLTLGQSISQGVPYLDQAIQAEAGNNATNITVWTTSQSSVVATDEIRHLMSIGSPLQDQLHFILTGNPNNPDGGFFERFVGFYVPGLDMYLNGATPPDSPYPTAIYTNQYDMAANFPQYILNPVSDINAIFGFAFGAHVYTPTDLGAAVQLPTSPGYTGQTTYYWIPTQNLPLVTPIRNLVIPPWDDAIADLLTPDLRVLVDMGYASGNYANIPTPGHFFELPDPFTIIPDLATGAVQGVTAFAVDLGWLPQSMMPTTYPFVPMLDPHLNFPIGQPSVTGVSLITRGEGLLMRSLALIPSWWDGM